MRHHIGTLRLLLLDKPAQFGNVHRRNHILHPAQFVEPQVNDRIERLRIRKSLLFAIEMPDDTLRRAPTARLRVEFHIGPFERRNDRAVLIGLEHEIASRIGRPLIIPDIDERTRLDLAVDMPVVFQVLQPLEVLHLEIETIRVGNRDHH